VPAVVVGLMGDAVVIARAPDPALVAIAETAGASLAIACPGADLWREGGSLARREWLLCLQSGDVPADGWMRAVDRFLVTAVRENRPIGRFSRRGSGAATALSRLIEGVAGTRAVRPGDVVQRNWLTAADAARVRPLRIPARIERDSVR
jgi:hypothetical protein